MHHHPRAPPPAGWFPANTSTPSLLADLLCGALGVIGFSWIASPAATELEAVSGGALGAGWGAPLLPRPGRCCCRQGQQEALRLP